jgi:YegS/Rv2252/BmrU family lipid kinase
MAEWLVAVNRSAGRRSIDPSVVAEIVRGTGVAFDVIAPDSIPAMIEAIADAAKGGHSRFALAGGDGTVNLAVNTLLEAGLNEPPTIAVLPTGTGCDILRTFGMSQKLGEAAQHLATSNTYLCDVVTLEGMWGTRYFLNVAQAGVGAAAAETAPKLTRRLGAVRYPLAFGVRLPRFPKANVRVTTEKRVFESEALAIIVANAQFFAGGWNVAPKANLVDGLVDIQIINARKSQAPALVPKVIKGTHLREPSVRRTTAAEFTIETEPAWPVEADGDLVGNTTVSGRVVPAAIRLKI